MQATTTVQQSMEWAYNQGKRDGWKNAHSEATGIINSLRAENLYLTKIIDSIPRDMWSSMILHNNLCSTSSSDVTAVVTAMPKQHMQN